MIDIKESQLRESKIGLFYAITNELRRRAKSALWKYEPVSPKAEAFHKSESRLRVIKGGNRSGKTRCVAREIVAMCEGGHPTKTRNMPPPITVWVVILSYQQYLNIILDAINLYISSPGVKYDKDFKTYYWPNGSKLVLKTAENPDSLYAEAVDVIWYDEEPEKVLWDKGKIRLIDHHGYAIFSFTPEHGISWTYDEFYQKHLKGDKSIDLYEFFTDENKFLSKEGYQEIIGSITDPAELAVRTRGDYVALAAKQVFKRYIPTIRDSVVQPQYRGVIYIHHPKDESPIVVWDEREDKAVRQGEYCVWEPPQPGAGYFMGVDCSEGINDYTSIVVGKHSEQGLGVVATLRKKMPPEEIPLKILAVAYAYNHALVNVERNSTGSSTLGILIEYYRNLFMSESVEGVMGRQIDSRDLGTQTTPKSKIAMIQSTLILLQQKRLHIYSDDIAREIEAFIETKDGKYKAQWGHDDMVMAMMLCVQAYNSLQANNFKRGSYEKRTRPNEYTEYDAARAIAGTRRSAGFFNT